MSAAKKGLIAVVMVLIAVSLSANLVAPSHNVSDRSLQAGPGKLNIPVHTPGKPEYRTNDAFNQVRLGSRDECDITFDHYFSVQWSHRRITVSELLPTPAYEVVSEQLAGGIEVAPDKTATARTIRLTAEKPCGKVVDETLSVFDLVCTKSGVHFSVAAILDPHMTQHKLLEAAKSLSCN